MKRYFITLTLLVMLSSGLTVAAAPNDPVNIPDATLRAAIEDELNKQPGDTITEADMAGMTELAPAGTNRRDVGDLTGLEYATNLTRLELSGSSVSRSVVTARPILDLSPLAKLTKLEQLAFSGLRITDISPLADLTELRYLGLMYAYGIDNISALSKLTKLIHLRLHGNYLTDITGVTGLINLRQITLWSNRPLSDISPLTQLINLEILRLDGTSITRDSLSAVLSVLSTEIDQMPIGEYPNFHITSGEVGFGSTNIADLSVLDSLPNVFLHSLRLRYMGVTAEGTRFFRLKDLTPLVELMNKGKVINNKTGIELAGNLGLDYESLYEDIPALMAGSRRVDFSYARPESMLEREFPQAASNTGYARNPFTFKVRAINTNPDVPTSWYRLTPNNTGVNREFAKVPVTWRVTAPDGTVTEEKVLTGDDGLSEVTITLGNNGETHSVEAVVPANTPAQGPSHPELKITFTAMAIAPPVITLTLDKETVTHTSLQWIAAVSGTLPVAYVYYYKKSADRDWIRYATLGRQPRRFGYAHFGLQPGTSYDFQVFALQGRSRVSPGSNVLTARTLDLKLAATDIQTTSVGLRITNFVSPPAAVDRDSFAYFYKHHTATAWPTSPQGTFRSRSTTVRNLTPGTSYDFQLFLYRDGARAGPGSNVVTVRTKSLTDPPVEPSTNRPPVFKSASAVSVSENTTGVITIVAEDLDAGDEITGYAITGGADASLFEISGARTPLDMLRFKTAPDFEMPGSAVNSNIYTLILTATSGVGARELTATQTLTITVTDVDESVELPVDPPVEPPIEPPIDPPVDPEPPVDPPVDPEPPVEPTLDDAQSFSKHDLVFSEIMYETQNTAQGLPQWYELYNTTDNPINIEGWSIQFHRNEPYLHVLIDIKESFFIDPKQAKIIATVGHARSSKHELLRPNNIYSLHDNHSAELKQDEDNIHLIIARKGFYMSLKDPSYNIIDEIGTMEDFSIAQSWELPDCLIKKYRSSLIRRFETKETPRDGTERTGWICASHTRNIFSSQRWYGHPTDLGTPTYKSFEIPLPVELSHFRPELIAGQVVISWTTESEVDNAGFNILRSEAKDAAFVQVNTKLIAGRGTTGERTQYTWIDTTAKPNTFYHYRIEDVSHAGVREQLATVQLRGLVAASDKLITSWADVKAHIAILRGGDAKPPSGQGRIR